MRKIAALIALSLLAMPSAGIEVERSAEGMVWRFTADEAKVCAEQGDCEVYTGARLAAMQLAAFKMGMAHQAKQCGGRI